MSDSVTGKSGQDKSGDKISKPMPIPDAASQQFFDGAKEGRLMIQRCTACGASRFVARARCDMCRSPDNEWITASGKAIIVSFAVMHQRYHPGFYDELPYPLAVVELEEGPRLITSLVTVEGVELKAGLALKAVYADVGEGIVLPKFTPA
jgi:uncharacterized OB-fold protein